MKYEITFHSQMILVMHAAMTTWGLYNAYYSLS